MCRQRLSLRFIFCAPEHEAVPVTALDVIVTDFVYGKPAATDSRITARTSRMRVQQSPASDANGGGALDHGGSLVQAITVRVESVRRDTGVAIGFGPALLLDRFAHPGQGFGAVTGQAARCIDQVAVPGTAGQTGVWRQGLIDLEHDQLETDEAAVGQF